MLIKLFSWRWVDDFSLKERLKTCQLPYCFCVFTTLYRDEKEVISSRRSDDSDLYQVFIKTSFNIFWMYSVEVYDLPLISPCAFVRSDDTQKTKNT